MGKPHTTPTRPDFISPGEAATIARCSVWTLARWARAGRLTRYARPGFKLSHCLYDRAQVEALAPRPV